MKSARQVILLAAVALALVSATVTAEPYPWPHGPIVRTIHNIEPPAGFHRLALEPGSFGAWLRELPLLPDNTPVHKWNGELKAQMYQRNHAAVVDLDVGNQNLQQCADAIMRLRAEYLWAMGRAADVNRLPGNQAKWKGGDWPAYRKYLNGVMANTGTATMAQSMPKPHKGYRLMPGDVIVQGGHPGHGMLVLDVVEDDAGHRKVLYGQSFMPAQQFHVLAQKTGKSPWFAEDLLREPGFTTLAWTKKPFTDADVRLFEPVK